MAQVNVRIAGRVYRMACGDGEEDHLRALAARLDGQIADLRGSFGEIGDGRITVMAALTIVDQLGEAERRLALAETDLGRLREAQSGADAAVEALAATVADSLAAAAERIERLAREVNGQA